MACYAPSADGRYYPNYAQGNAPVASNVIVGNAYATGSAVGALSTGAGFGGLANAPILASGLLNTSIAARGAASAPVICGGVFTTHPGGNTFTIVSPVALANGQTASAYGPISFSTVNGVAPITYSATGLPPGMTYSAAGVLGGTPTASGSYNPIFIATDSSGGPGISTPVALELILDNEGPGGSVQGITNLDIPNSLVQANGTPYPNMPVLAAATVTAGDTAILIHTVATQAGNWPNVSGQDTQGGGYTTAVQIVNKSNNQGAPSTNITQQIEMLVGALGGLKAGAYRGTVNLGTPQGGVGDTDFQALRLLTARNITALVGVSSNNQIGSNGNGNVAPGTPITSDSAGVGIPVTQAQLPAFLLVVSFNQSGAGTNGTLAPAIPPGSPLQLIDKKWQFNGSVAPVTVPQATFAFQQLTSPGNALATFNTTSNVDEAYMTIAAVFSGVYVPSTGATATETLPLTITGALLPAAPGNEAVTAAGNGSVTVSYTAPTANGSPVIDSYLTTAVPTSGSTVTKSVTGLQCPVTGLTNGTQYSLSTQAHNANGYGPPSAVVTATPQATAGSPAANALAFITTAQNDGEYLIGQHMQYYEGNTNDATQAWTSITPLFALTGQLPAIMGGTANWYHDSLSNWNPYTTSGGGQPSLNVLSAMIAEWCSSGATTNKPQAGAGIVQLNWGLGSPVDGTGNGISSQALSQCVTPGQGYYTYMQNAALALQTYLLSVVATSPRVVLILRLFAELNGSWWHSVGNTQTDINNQIKLHQQAWTTIFSGAGASLRSNVLVAYCANSYSYNGYKFPPQAAWPGNSYADIAAWDTYDGYWGSALNNGNADNPIDTSSFAAFRAFGVPLMMCEAAPTDPAYSNPTSLPINTTSNLLIPNWLRGKATVGGATPPPPMFGWVQWNDNNNNPNNGGAALPSGKAGSMSICLQENASTLMNASYAIPLSKLPAF